VEFLILVVEAWLRHAGGFDIVVLEAISHEVDVDEVRKITRRRGLSRLPGQDEMQKESGRVWGT